ncbi:MAG TPA: ABC transporter substrate-binding protein [Candidatus Dormibacteraeota bacterium]|nr:ABC transporter substrate-binding protein [Candidatus Dormibacteraeota bacterium]
MDSHSIFSRRWRPAVGLAGMGLVLAACGSSTNNSTASNAAASGPPIYIGYNGELSGPSAAFGVPTLHGTQLAVDEINSSGGIGGRPVSLTVYDNEGNASKAVSLQSKIVGDSKNLAMIGLNFGADNKAALPVSDAAGMPTFTFDWVGLSFAGPTRYAVTIDVVADNAKLFSLFKTTKFQSAKKIAIWAADTPVFQAANAAAAKQIQDATGIVPKLIYFPAGTTDYSAQAEQLIQYAPDVVLDSGATAADMVGPIKEVKRQGALPNTIWISTTFVIPGVTTIAGPATVAGGITVSLVDFNKASVKSLAAKVKAKYSGENLSYGQVQGYDAMMTLATAMKKPGALASRSALNAAIDGLQNVKPIGGPEGYTFSFAPGAGKQHDAFSSVDAYSFILLQPDGSFGAYVPGA